MDLDAVLEEIHAEVAPIVGSGEVADYIPGLALVDSHQFGMVVTMNDGQVGPCRR